MAATAITQLKNIRLKDLHPSPLAAMILGTALLGFGGVFVRSTTADFGEIGLYRCLTGAIVFSCFYKPKPQAVRKKVSIFAILAGLFFYLDLTLWHRSILYSGAGIATLLNGMQVLILAAYGAMFDSERLDRRFVTAMSLAAIGLISLCSFPGETQDQNYSLGILYGAASGLCYAFFVLALRKAQKDRPCGSQAMRIVSIACAVFFLLETLLTKGSLSILPKNDLILLLAYGLSTQVLAWYLIAQALPKVQPSLIGLTLLLQPGLAYFWDWIVFNIPISGEELFGGLLILSAVCIGRKRASPEHRRGETKIAG